MIGADLVTTLCDEVTVDEAEFLFFFFFPLVPPLPNFFFFPLPFPESVFFVPSFFFLSFFVLFFVGGGGLRLRLLEARPLLRTGEGEDFIRDLFLFFFRLFPPPLLAPVTPLFW